MPIAPIIPSSGLTGWNFLKSSLETQTKLFNSSADISRDVDYFNENIGDIETLDDFMSDRRILKVALGAFGLEDEINKGAFVRKILEEGTTDSSAFGVRLNNTDYLDMARVFDFTGGELSLSDSQIQNVTDSYQAEAFEVSLGGVDNTMRLSLNFEREIADIATQGLSENAGWFKVMGSLPLREVIESAFNMPEGFSQLDIDQQKELLSDKSNQLFGGKGVEVFQNPEAVETTIRRYLLQEQIASGPSANTPGFTALSLFNSSGFGTSSIFNLLLSNTA